ncbi:MAG: hypothetical protein JWR20_2678 [Marmoricola sp.]|nr:hypothetical protein [Marmoricola sp.]
MDSGLSIAIDPRDVLVVALLSAVVLAVAVAGVRHQARRGGWSVERTSNLTWSVGLGSVALLGLFLVLVLGLGATAEYGFLSYSPEPERITFTLVWLPCVLGLLWSVLHLLRGGAGRTPALLDLRPALALAALWLVSLPLQITVFTVGLLGVLTWVGLVLWLAGQALVAGGRSVPGDVVVWAGVALVAADAWPGYVGLVSPLVVAVLAARSRHRGRADAVLS